jgi:sugar phosphate isomerase/epimerase
MLMNRRSFLQLAALGGVPICLGPGALDLRAAAKGAKMRFGLVTYQWGRNWDLPTLIANCEQSRTLGVELRVDHKHGVSPKLTPAERREVKQRFAASPVTCVGMGTNEDYHHPDPAVVRQKIANTKAWLQLSHDIGGSGVKVKPNDLPKNVPHEQTIEQIGRSLNEVARFGADLGQQIRLEVHGGCSELPIIKAIMEVANHPNATVCWNCNGQDLQGAGLAANFNLVKDRFGATVHVREFNTGNYPYPELMKLFVAMDYAGWILLEARVDPKDPIQALIDQRELFEKLTGQRA